VIITARQSSREAAGYRAGGAGVGEVAVTGAGGVVSGVSDECDSPVLDGTGVDGPGVDGAPGVASAEVDGSPSVVVASVSVVVGDVVGVVVVVVGRVCTAVRGAQV